MSSVSLGEISAWVDSVGSTPQDLSVPSLSPQAYNDKEKPRPVNKIKRRFMDDNAHPEDTPRPSKQQRDADNTPQTPLGELGFVPSLSPRKSNASTSDITMASNQSSRFGPLRQLQVLADDHQPILFRNFCDVEDYEERADVATMRCAIQRLADGVGILGYEDVQTVTASLSSTMDRLRFEYSWANECPQRLTYGGMPPLACLEAIVRKGWARDRGPGDSKDIWHTEVHYPLLRLALETCKHEQRLNIHAVKTSTIDPKSLARTKEGFPRRNIDYVVALKSDEITKQAWKTPEPLSLDGRKTVKSWNHVTRADVLRTEPIAINIETKGPYKSWTDGKPQVAIWTDAWLNRLERLPRAQEKSEPWPAIPLLIAQGHDWHLLVLSRDGEKTIIWDKIAVGSTRSCFDAMKLVAVLHWCMDWAETVWRPWFLSLI
ncbi:hypothetical protein IAQ61_006931 [Plenodomus lingam]|uniref:uncharacterized protein n=1 Tax=Leptosphaeria maculans TaxID=5022 RepID=UPI003329D2C4|nr:hypothetical protein IAQ61_006931 [Plenodomus lingam]